MILVIQTKAAGLYNSFIGLSLAYNHYRPSNRAVGVWSSVDIEKLKGRDIRFVS